MCRLQLSKLCQNGIFILSIIALVIHGCASTKPTSTDPTGYLNRTESFDNEELALRVAVPTISEAEAIYGVNLASKNIQPIWLEVNNKSDVPYWFLPSGLDPEYFSPSEVAFAFSSDEEIKYQQLKDKFQKLTFQNPIRPGITESGFVLVNLDEGFKAVDIDLLSQENVKNYSFIFADPDFKADYKNIDARAGYAEEDIIYIENEKDLIRVLEELPCCTTNASGDKLGDPLNLVLIGEVNDILPALIRRNWHATETIWSRALMRMFNSFLRGERYRYSPISALHFYGRRHDIGFQKSRSTINERNHMRFWQSPIRFRGKKVYVGQISRDIGVKLTLKAPTIATHIIDPDVDEARRYFVEDMAYSQAVSSIGYVKGDGVVKKETPNRNLVGDPYYTDGLRAVLIFESRPNSLSDIDLLEWEYPSARYTELNARFNIKQPSTLVEAQIQQRASTDEKNGIRASAAVVGDEEAKELFGIDIVRKKIQAVWIKIENNSDRSVFMLPTSIDHDYFSPLEVSHAFHKSFASKANATLDEYIQRMNFPNRKRIVPRSIASGYIFTNWTKGTKVIDVDLIGRDFSQNFTFFAHNPDNTEGVQVVQSIEKIYPISDIQDVKSEFELRRILEGLPCCVSREDGTPSGEPINLVLIGKLEDWATGIVRRGYRYHKMTPRYAFGRKSDISGYKISREYKNPQTHAVRLWKTPTRYKGKPVWVGQTSNRFGGRFAEKMPIEETLPIDPSVDEVRIDLTQDLAYSQTLIKIGHVKGGGRSKLNQSNASEKGLQYDTDGLRVVLVFGERPVSLSEIDFFNWEKLSDYR